MTTATSEVVAFDAKAYPSPKPDGSIGNAILLTVLVQRLEGTVKAYAAIVPDSSLQDPRYREPAAWVHRFGNPLRFREARAVWPGLEEREYAQ